MASYEQWEGAALERLGFCGTNGSQDRERAVSVVIELLKELERLHRKLEVK